MVFVSDTLYGKMYDFSSTMMFLAKVSTDFTVFFHLYPERYIPFTSPHFSNFLCDRVCTQGKKLKEDILVVLDRAKCELEHGV